MRQVLTYPQVVGSALSVDTNDPNTTAPTEDRTFYGPVQRETTPTAAYVLAIGGQITIELWMQNAQLNRWFKVAAATACPADTLTYLPTIPPVDGGKLFARITANSNGTQYAVGFQGSR